MLHLTKLAVGVRDTDHLRELQAARSRDNPPLRHRTRNTPRRRTEVLNGGWLHWVTHGPMLARRRILHIPEERCEGQSASTALILHPGLRPLARRPTRRFQGWRYLEPD